MSVESHMNGIGKNALLLFSCQMIGSLAFGGYP